MKRMIPYAPLHDTVADSMIPFFVRPSHWYPLPPAPLPEFDATESMSFDKYILATKPRVRRSHCDGYMVVVDSAATGFAEMLADRKREWRNSRWPEAS